VPMIVQLLSSSASASQQLQLLAVVSALAHGSEEGSSELQEAGVDEVLLEMVTASPMPRTQVGFLSCMYVWFSACFCDRRVCCSTLWRAAPCHADRCACVNRFGCLHCV
jgi:hypothetical protein